MYDKVSSELMIDNNDVRIMKWSFDPNQSTGLHIHIILPIPFFLSLLNYLSINLVLWLTLFIRLLKVFIR